MARMVDNLLILLIALGLLSSIIGTMIGGGGGLVLVPFLILFLHQSANGAIATSFVAFTVGALVSTFAYWRQGRVDYHAGLVLGVLTLPGVVLGALITDSIPAPLFNFILGIVIALLTIPILFRREARQKAHLEPRWSRHFVDAFGNDYDYIIDRKIAMASAALTGLFSGAFGAGGGLLLTPALVLSGFPIHVALATTRLVALVLCSGASVTRFSLGQVTGEFALWLSAGAVGGALLGARLVRVAQSKLLTRLVSLTVFALGMALAAESLFGAFYGL
jgi:uncharacterized membrane protein YfcA